MPVSPAVRDFWLTRLQSVNDSVSSRPMFGGVGVYADGLFVGVLDNDRLYFKSDAETEPLYDAIGAERWVIEGPGGGVMPYREITEAQLDQLGEWLTRAVEVSARKKRPSRRKAGS